jgi:hypothetical protein
MDADSFTDAHQRSIGVALKLFDDLISSVRTDGLEDESLSALQAAVAEIAEITGAKAPRPKRNELHAKLAQMLVHAMERTRAAFEPTGSYRPRQPTISTSSHAD